MAYKPLSEAEHEELMRRFIAMGINGKEAGKRVAMIMHAAEMENAQPTMDICREVFFTDDYQKAARKFVEKYAKYVCSDGKTH